MRLYFKIIVSAVLLLTSCNKNTQNTSCDASYSSLYREASFPIGASVNIELLQTNMLYRDVVIQQFYTIKPETSYLLSKIHPDTNFYDFSEFDYLVEFCKNYNKRLEGANLMYQLYLPRWMYSYQGSKSDWEKVTHDHIQKVVGRYKGVVKSWMVVNEALAEDGTLQKNFWLDKIGPDYIEKFFRWTHEADPDADLFYNDFDLESNRPKLKAAIDIVEMLRGHGVRVTGLGMQMHISDTYPSVEEIAGATELVASHHIPVYYSEWDISLNLLNNHSSLTDAMKQRQKRIVQAVVRNYCALPKDLQYGISFWNVGDADSWIRPFFHRQDWPLLFDDNYNAKPSYCGFLEGLK